MNKVRMYIVNGFYSSLIGAVIEVIIALIRKCETIRLISLFDSMLTGVFIGTVSMFFLFHIFFKLKKRPVAGFVSNFVVVAVVFIADAALSWIEAGRIVFYINWMYAWIIAELLSFILTAVWYKEIKLYNEQLEKKKASLGQEV